jgi:hypothetical protein
MGTFSIWHWLVVLIFVGIVFTLYWGTYKLCKRVPPANPKSNEPAGVAGWLLLLVVGLFFIGPYLGLGRLLSDIFSTEETYPSLKGFQAWINYKLATWAVFAFIAGSSIYAGYGLAFGRKPSAVKRVKMVMWLVVPGLSLFMNIGLPYLFFDLTPVEADYMSGLVGYFFSIALWTLYLSKSKRVRNTYIPSSDTTVAGNFAKIPHENKAIDTSVISQANSPQLEDKAFVETDSQQNKKINTIVPKTSPADSSNQETIQILLDYDEQAKQLADELVDLPTGVRDKVVLSLVNTSEELQVVRRRALLEALGRPDLTWNDELELMIKKCRNAGVDISKEVFRVFSVLSKRMSPLDVFATVSNEAVQEFSVLSAGGNKVKVIRHGESNFVVHQSFGVKVFSSIEETYEYLGTPKEKRISI